MTITTTLTLQTVENDIDRLRFGPDGCFGRHNWLNGYNFSNDQTVSERTDQLEVLEFWPHTSADRILSGVVGEAIDLMNSFGPYHNMFYLTPANSVGVNLRENPCDKVFTGLMTIRDVIYGNHNTWMWLADGEEDEETKLLLKRIALVLRISGVSRDMFGAMNVESYSSSGTNEAAAIFLHPSHDALSLFFLVFGTPEQCADCWAQHPMGEGVNVNGYVRNGRSEISTIRSERNYRNGHYNAMSHWLNAWVMENGHKDAAFDEKRGRLTVQAFYRRLSDRTRGVTDTTTVKQIIIELFNVLKDMYV